jgi:hypothetical protein
MCNCDDLYKQDRENRRERGPPPVVNERFAKMADEEREKVEKRAPAPVVQNSRFAAAAAEMEAERDRFDKEREERRSMRDAEMDNGPPPPPMPVNSRFAAVAADHEIEREREMKERDERRADRGEHQRFDRGMGRGPPMDTDGPPPPLKVSSRFAAAVAEHEVERERETRERDDRRAEREARYGERSNRYEDGGGENRRFGDGGGGGDRRFGRRGDRDVEQHSEAFLAKKKTTFVRPEMPKHLQPKKKEEPVLPAGEVILTLPGEDEEAAKARIEKKRREEEEKRIAEQKKAEEDAARKIVEEAEAAEKAAKAASLEGDLLSGFANGSALGADLQKWCEEQGSFLPSVEKLVYSLLIQTQKDNQDLECSWAEPDKHGAALLSLVGDNTLAQVEVLWGIQKFCNEIGFPKVKNENLVQGMFRAMYKYDLAEADAFDVWKEDMSPAHDLGKGKAIIQTMDWFNWLEEDDEEEEEYEDYAEEY